MKKIKEKIFYIVAIGVSIFLLFFMIATAWIGYEVKDICEDSKRLYSKSDCVESLILLLDDRSKDYRSRNDAIWALGQLGDERALPILNKYYTGEIPSREPLDKTISQYELKKAIELANGGFNIGAFLWRGMIK